MKKQQLLGSLLLLAVAVIWGTAFVFQRVGMDSIEPVTFTASRMTLSAVAVGILAVFLNKKETRGETAKRKSSARYSVIGGVFCGIFLASASIFQQKGIVYTTAGKAGFITAFYILLVPVIGFVIFRKRNTWLVWLAVLLGIAGMYLLCISDGFRLAQGDTYVFICAVYFVSIILSGKGMRFRLRLSSLLLQLLFPGRRHLLRKRPALRRLFRRWYRLHTAALSPAASDIRSR